MKDPDFSSDSAPDEWLPLCKSGHTWDLSFLFSQPRDLPGLVLRANSQERPLLLTTTVLQHIHTSSHTHKLYNLLQESTSPFALSASGYMSIMDWRGKKNGKEEEVASGTKTDAIHLPLLR